MVKNLPANAGDTGDAGSSLGREDALEEEMAARYSVLAWRSPWTEAPGGLKSTQLHKELGTTRVTKHVPFQVCKQIKFPSNHDVGSA